MCATWVQVCCHMYRSWWKGHAVRLRPLEHFYHGRLKLAVKLLGSDREVVVGVHTGSLNIWTAVNLKKKKLLSFKQILRPRPEFLI